MELKLSDRIASLEKLLAVGHITSDEFDSAVVATLKDDSNKRKQNTARYVIRITNDTTGSYSYGATTYYVDTKFEADEIFTAWFEQDNISAVTSTRVEGAEVSGAIKMVNGNRVSTTLVTVDRRFKH